MPHKSEKMKIGDKKYDKRVKLTDDDKENIRKEYETGLVSINGLARKYNVSKRLIQFTLFPERAERAKQLYAERRKDGKYYDKEKHKKYMKDHRHYKKELYEKGVLKEMSDVCEICNGDGIMTVDVEYPDGEGGYDLVKQDKPCKCQ